VTAQALAGVERCYANAGELRAIRLHGDCHVGNILWTDDGPHFVDLDDARMGPGLQDLWMLLSGNRATMGAQMHHVLAGYEEFADFDRRQLHLLEALRTLRLIHYSRGSRGAGTTRPSGGFSVVQHAALLADRSSSCASRSR